jgi:nitroimidazol reductase NimA-like FMN-containing flavoprotein (pyridoxamine 5'-phosphate oxidase superfamily)
VITPMHGTPRGRRLVVMADEECWRLLASRPWGRLAVVVADHPEVFPVDHQVDNRTLLVRTEAGTKLRAAVGARVGFEVDDVDDDERLGWSVMVAGYAEAVPAHGELDVDDAVMNAPLWTGERVHWLRIVPFKVTGRRLVALEA